MQRVNSVFKIFFFLEESDSVALYFFLHGYIEEIIEENPEMEKIVNARGGLPVFSTFRSKLLNFRAESLWFDIHSRRYI
jgi:hypothetical protein